MVKSIAAADAAKKLQEASAITQIRRFITFQLPDDMDRCRIGVRFSLEGAPA